MRLWILAKGVSETNQLQATRYEETEIDCLEEEAKQEFENLMQFLITDANISEGDERFQGWQNDVLVAYRYSFCYSGDAPTIDCVVSEALSSATDVLFEIAAYDVTEGFLCSEYSLSQWWMDCTQAGDMNDDLKEEVYEAVVDQWVDWYVKQYYGSLYDFTLRILLQQKLCFKIDHAPETEFSELLCNDCQNQLFDRSSEFKEELFPWFEGDVMIIPNKRW